MTNEQALQIMKSIIDAAVKGSIFPNMDAAFQAANAYNQIAQSLINKENGSNNQ